MYLCSSMVRCVPDYKHTKNRDGEGVCKRLHVRQHRHARCRPVGPVCVGCLSLFTTCFEALIFIPQDDSTLLQGPWCQIKLHRLWRPERDCRKLGRRISDDCQVPADYAAAVHSRSQPTADNHAGPAGKATRSKLIVNDDTLVK